VRKNINKEIKNTQGRYKNSKENAQKSQAA